MNGFADAFLHRALLEYRAIEEFIGDSSLSYSMSMSFSFPLISDPTDHKEQEDHLSLSNSDASGWKESPQQPSSSEGTPFITAGPPTAKTASPSTTVDASLDEEQERSPHQTNSTSEWATSKCTMNLVIILLSAVVVALMLWLAWLSLPVTHGLRLLSPAAESLLRTTHDNDAVPSPANPAADEQDNENAV